MNGVKQQPRGNLTTKDLLKDQTAVTLSPVFVAKVYLDARY
jgi:hypothetical protein